MGSSPPSSAAALKTNLAAEQRGKHALLTRIEMLHVPNVAICWEMEAGRALTNWPPLNAHVKRAQDTPDFCAGLKKLQSVALPKGGALDDSKELMVLHTFHGHNCKFSYNLAAEGIQPLRTTDGGYFGSGPYTTLEAEYACRYS